MLSNIKFDRPCYQVVLGCSSLNYQSRRPQLLPAESYLFILKYLSYSQVSYCGARFRSYQTSCSKRRPGGYSTNYNPYSSCWCKYSFSLGLHVLYQNQTIRLGWANLLVQNMLDLFPQKSNSKNKQGNENQTFYFYIELLFYCF